VNDQREGHMACAQWLLMKILPPPHEPKGEEGFPPAFLPTDVAEAANYTIQRLKNPIHSIRQSMF
jgi:hypothetical protein